MPLWSPDRRLAMSGGRRAVSNSDINSNARKACQALIAFTLFAWGPKTQAQRSWTAWLPSPALLAYTSASVVVHLSSIFFSRGEIYVGFEECIHVVDSSGRFVARGGTHTVGLSLNRQFMMSKTLRAEPNHDQFESNTTKEQVRQAERQSLDVGRTKKDSISID